jgi:hypothetical protein
MSLARLLRHAVAASLLAAALAVPATAGAADPPRYRAYYAAFDRGPALIPGHDTGLDPQGLGYWPARDALIISYYDDAGGASRIAIVDRASGKRIKTLLLRTTGHVGGLGMTQSGHLWIANNGKLVRYSSAALAKAGDGDTVRSDRSFDVPASSFVGVRRNDIWVGRFARSESPKMYPYRVTAGGDLRSAGSATPVPRQTQGLAVTDDHFIFTRSFGRDADSRIESFARRVPIANGPMLTAPNMAEGAVLAHGEVHVLYESGSAKYDDADYRVRTVHHAPARALGG